MKDELIRIGIKTCFFIRGSMQIRKVKGLKRVVFI